MTNQQVISTGSAVLDSALQGGLPKNRSTLLIGTPGTGKSTLAMQFLQEGLRNDEDCLFISTEQTHDELLTSFSAFDFDLDHENLTIATLHATSGETIHSEDDELVLRSLEGGEQVPGEEFGIPFTSGRIQEHLERYAPCDRVALDSVSGLKLMSEGDAMYRRTVLDLIRQFTDEFEATSVFTAEHTGAPQREEAIEGVGAANLVQFNVNGVIRLWRELIGGNYHRFLDIMKMRGLNHDTRRYEIEFGDNGVNFIPQRRFHSPEFIKYPRTSTGVDGLDELSGGGLLKGTGSLLEHDGQANFDVILSRLLLEALNNDRALTLLPTVDMKWGHVAQLLEEYPKSVADLLQDDELFIIDMLGAWEAEHRNVFDVQREDASVRYILQMIDDRAMTEGQFYVLNTEAKVHGIGREDARSFRYWLEANHVDEVDIHLDIHNPNLMSDELAAFYVDAAGQVLRTWMADSGLQYINLKKSPIGSVGTTRLVEYLDEYPYVRIQQQ